VSSGQGPPPFRGPLDPAPDAGQTRKRFIHAEAQGPRSERYLQLARQRRPAVNTSCFHPVAGRLVGEQGRPDPGLCPPGRGPRCARPLAEVAALGGYCAPSSVDDRACSLRPVATRGGAAAGGRALRPPTTNPLGTPGQPEPDGLNGAERPWQELLICAQTGLLQLMAQNRQLDCRPAPRPCLGLCDRISLRVGVRPMDRPPAVHLHVENWLKRPNILHHASEPLPVLPDEIGPRHRHLRWALDRLAVAEHPAEGLRAPGRCSPTPLPRLNELASLLPQRGQFPGDCGGNRRQAGVPCTRCGPGGPSPQLWHRSRSPAGCRRRWCAVPARCSARIEAQQPCGRGRRAREPSMAEVEPLSRKIQIQPGLARSRALTAASSRGPAPPLPCLQPDLASRPALGQVTLAALHPHGTPTRQCRSRGGGTAPPWAGRPGRSAAASAQGGGGAADQQPTARGCAASRPPPCPRPLPGAPLRRQGRGPVEEWRCTGVGEGAPGHRPQTAAACHGGVGADHGHRPPGRPCRLTRTAGLKRSAGPRVRCRCCAPSRSSTSWCPSRPVGPRHWRMCRTLS